MKPAEEAGSFRLADERLAIELVAAEPGVISPVAIAWDADGAMFVAEMIDYPLGPESGQIRRLEDLDGDGFYETAKLFADTLPFPNSVLPWKDGLLVTAAPNIWFVRDTDGDGQADERRVLFTGFGEGNPQLRANGLHWGLDNWVYGANGRSDGEVRRPDDPPGKRASIRNHDFRFRPETGEFEAIAGRSQFGRARDDWGRQFLSWNTIPIRHVVVEERYLNRQPLLRISDAAFDILPPGDTAQVFPLTPPPLVFNKESSSHFNALAGLTIYCGDALGEAYRGNAFAGESLRNLVHRRVLEPKGVTFVARRGEAGEEFLASTDPWFHPVNFATGPDGALYVVDFYRQFVEHPEYVHNASVEKRVPWRTGAEHGRIWRISRKGAKPSRTRPQLSSAPTPELVKRLRDSNAWWRDTAQRLLVERRDPAAFPLLKAEVRNGKSETPLARLHALWALQGLDELDGKTILAALGDKSPRIREQAVLLSEPALGSLASASKSSTQRNTGRPGIGTSSAPLSSATTRALEKALLRLVEDADPRVRFQLALTLGETDKAEMQDVLAELAKNNIGDRWQSLAILSSVRMRPWPFFQRVLRLRAHSTGTGAGLVRPGEDTDFFVEKCGRLVGAGPNEEQIESILSTYVLGASGRTDASITVLLAGMADGLEERGQSLRERVKQIRARSKASVWKSAPFFDHMLQAAKSEAERTQVRVAAIRLLAEAEPTSISQPLIDLLPPHQPAPVQSAAVQALAKLARYGLASNPFLNWSHYTQTTRRQLTSVASRSPLLSSALLDALEQKRIAAVEIDASSRQSLQRAQNSEVRDRAQKFFQNMSSPDRDEVLRQFSPVLEMAGDAKRGAAVFAKTCLVCHRIQGRGGQVGPDLSGIASRPPEAVLADILDPSRQVTPDFLSYTVVTAQGDSLTGLMAAETPTSLTLRRQSLPDETIRRSQIQEVRADAKSLMPDGLEQGLTRQEMADLLAFLSQPDGSWLP